MSKINKEARNRSDSASTQTAEGGSRTVRHDSGLIFCTHMAGKTVLTHKEKVQTRSAATAFYQPSLDRKEIFRAFDERILKDLAKCSVEEVNNNTKNKRSRHSFSTRTVQQRRKSDFSNNQPENLIQLAAGAQLWQIQSKIDTTR